MRNAVLLQQTTLSDAPYTGLIPRQAVSITVKDRETGEPVMFCFWSGDYNRNLNVISGTTGAPVARAFVGGVGLSVGEVTKVSDLTIHNVTVNLTSIPFLTQQLVRGYEARLAKVEYHSLLLSPVSREPIGVGEIEFLGEIDSAPIETPAVNGEGGIIFTMVSDVMSMLARQNPRRRSDEGQRRRLDDRIFRYSNGVANWTVPWGGEGDKNRGTNNGGNRGGGVFG